MGEVRETVLVEFPLCLLFGYREKKSRKEFDSGGGAEENNTSILLLGVLYHEIV